MSTLLSAGRERAVLHFNVADFAVAVERVADTGLCRRPLLIAPLGAARAVVYDMSEEAYGEGVRKGMPLRRATRLCPRAALLPPRPDLYARAMGAFFRELQGYSPLIEVGDVDGHFFVDVTGTHRLHGPAVDIGWRVRRRARAALGINPIWTLGSGKVVAKVASRLVKPVGEYIVAPGEEEAFLAPLPVRLLPGLSGRELQRLEAFSLTTVGALAELSRQQLLVAFGSRCHYLHGLSHGIDEEPVRPPGAAQEMFLHQHLFADDSNDREEVTGIVATLVGPVVALSFASTTPTAATRPARPCAATAPQAISSCGNWLWPPLTVPGPGALGCAPVALPVTDSSPVRRSCHFSPRARSGSGAKSGCRAPSTSCASVTGRGWWVSAGRAWRPWDGRGNERCFPCASVPLIRCCAAPPRPWPCAGGRKSSVIPAWP